MDALVRKLPRGTYLYHGLYDTWQVYKYLKDSRDEYITPYEMDPLKAMQAALAAVDKLEGE